MILPRIWIWIVPVGDFERRWVYQSQRLLKSLDQLEVRNDWQVEHLHHNFNLKMKIDNEKRENERVKVKKMKEKIVHMELNQKEEEEEGFEIEWFILIDGKENKKRLMGVERENDEVIYM